MAARSIPSLLAPGQACSAAAWLPCSIQHCSPRSPAGLSSRRRLSTQLPCAADNSYFIPGTKPPSLFIFNPNLCLAPMSHAIIDSLPVRQSRSPACPEPQNTSHSFPFAPTSCELVELNQHEYSHNCRIPFGLHLSGATLSICRCLQVSRESASLRSTHPPSATLVQPLPPKPVTC